MGKTPGYEEKALKVYDLVMAGNSLSKISEDLSLTRKTVTEMYRSIQNSDEIQTAIKRSKDRLIGLLERCDHKLREIIESSELDQRGLQLQAIRSIYKSFGILKDEPDVQINTMIQTGEPRVIIKLPHNNRDPID